jgi:hypothetical protein
VGSYDGHFYALDARSGRPRWVRWIGTKISGAATIVGDLVFVSDLAKKTTWALGAHTGQTVWKTRRGGFNPVISDGRRIYFAGFSSLFALDHETRPPPRRAAGATRAQQAATRSARRRAEDARRARAQLRDRAARRARAARHARDVRRARAIRLGRAHCRTSPACRARVDRRDRAGRHGR